MREPKCWHLHWDERHLTIRPTFVENAPRACMGEMFHLLCLQPAWQKYCCSYFHSVTEETEV